jgi:hypothetical protein
MNKKTITIVLAIILIASFFLPYLSVPGYDFSGFHVAFGKDGMSGLVKGGKLLLLCLLIPLGGIVVLIDSLGDSSSSNNLGYWMPLLGAVILAILMYTGMKPYAGSELTIGRFLGVMGYGFWITLGAAIGLLVNNNKI